MTDIERDILPTDNIPRITADELAIRNQDITDQVQRFEDKGTSLPASIDDDATSGIWSDFVKEIDTLSATVEGKREAEKAPVLQEARTIDGFYKAISDRKGSPGRLERLRYKVTTLIGAHLRRKQLAEQRRLDEEARKAREEEARKLAEAAAAQKKADEARRAATIEKHKETATRAEADATSAASRAFEAEQRAAAPPADRARTRGSASLATLAVSWTAEITDQERIPIADLAPYFTKAQIEAALRQYIKAKAPKTIRTDQDWQPLRGVNMVRNLDPHIR